MSTNNDFNSKKIIEEIENLDNDLKSKKGKAKSKIPNFFESLILIVLIIVLIKTVGAQFIEEIFEDSDYDYYEEDYSYESDYTDSSSYDDSENTTNTTSNLMTIEEFMNSDLKNTLLTEKVQQQENVTTSENTIEETIENTTVTEESIEVKDSEIEEPVEEYDEEEVVRQKFEEEKKRIIIEEEGKSINQELIFSIKNANTNYIHSLAVYTVFYKSNNIVGVDLQTVDVILADNKKYIKVPETPEDYDRFEVFISKYDYDEYSNELLTDNVTYESHMESDLLKIDISNSGKKINKVTFTILYYGEGHNLLDIETVSDYSVNKYTGGSATGYGVWNETEEEYVKYRNYNIILDYAERYTY